MYKKFLTLLISTLLIISCDNFLTDNDDDNQNPNIEHRLYVLNGLGSTISLINLDDGTVDNDVYTTGIFPSDIQYINNKLYVVNSGDNNIQIIDIPSGSSDIIELGDNRNPSHMELYGDNMGAVCNWISGTVSFLDFNINSVVTEVSVGAGLWGMTYYEGKIFTGITNYDPSSWSYGQGYVAVLDANTYALLDSIQVGANPGVLFIDHQNELNAVCTGDYFMMMGEVYRCNVNDYTVIDSYEIGGSPSYEALSEDGMVFLGNGGWVDEGYVLSYDSQSETILHGGADPIILAGEPGIQGLAIDNEGYIYACAFNSDHLIKMDADGNVLETYNVGDGPQTAIYVEY